MKTKLFLIIVCSFVCSTIAFADEDKDPKDEQRRLFIEDFLDTYKAAYEKKEIEYISDFFSTDALIITETKQLIKNGAEIAPRSTKKRPYKLIVEDKKEYIERLKQIFEQEIKIKLSVAGKRVVQHSLYPEIYGVSFLQMWTDQNGTDNLESKMPGYIFLMIDFKENENQPIIHVRTWQPQDNIKSPKDKYNLMDFRVYEFTE